MGGALLSVVDRLHGRDEPPVGPDGLSGVGVAIEPREVAAGYLQPYAVALSEEVAGGPEVDVVLVGPAWLDETGRPAGLPEPGAVRCLPTVQLMGGTCWGLTEVGYVRHVLSLRGPHGRRWLSRWNSLDTWD
mgnify:CR=1 FL=1